MADYISNLPDDILSCLLSSLTVRDSFRLRSLSPTWKDLPDTRSVLLFDGYTILKGGSVSRRSAFVQAADQFFKLWKPHKATALKIEFGLENEYASHIDAWIATVIGKEIEELDLDFYLFGFRIDKYVFPCHLLDTEKGSCLKHFRLRFCDMTLSSDVHTSWLNKLSTLELIDVSLDLSDIECVLSNTVKLESLSLKQCGYGGNLCVQHPSLKKLALSQNFLHLELICPRLEIFEYSGITQFMFSSIPLLREASLELHYGIRRGSLVFSDLAGRATCLQTLFLLVTTEILPVPRGLTISCLKRLDLLTVLPSGFDVFAIAHMLYASPVLEELRLKRDPNMVSVKPRRRLYVNRPHYHLKEVIFEEDWAAFYCFELAEYLIKNCLALQQMIFEVGAEANPIFRAKPNFIALQNNNPTVELIVV